MNANRDLLQYYNITFTSFSYDCLCCARRRVLSCAADKNYHNRILSLNFLTLASFEEEKHKKIILLDTFLFRPAIQDSRACALILSAS